MQTKRLTIGDRDLARTLFSVMAKVFEEDSDELSDGDVLSDEYLDRLLSRQDFWAIAAFVGDEIVGGVTAHTLPMTRTEVSELFIYDLAVRADHQRRGIGRHLITVLREGATMAGIETVFVPADNEDTHALDFYQALGGDPAPVTIFTFSDDNS